MLINQKYFPSKPKTSQISVQYNFNQQKPNTYPNYFTTPIQIYNKQKNNKVQPAQQMRSSRTKIKVTVSHQTKCKEIDRFLSSQYQAWKQSNQPRTTTFGIFNCGTSGSNELIMDYVRSIYSQYKIADPLDGVVMKKIVDSDTHKTPKRVGPRAATQQHIQISQQKDVQEFQVNLYESKIMQEGHARRMSDPYSQTIPKKALFDSRQSTHHNNHHRDSSVFERGTLGSTSNQVQIIRKLDDSSNNHYRNTQPMREIQSVQLLEGESNRSNQNTPTYTPKQNKNTEESKKFIFSRKINSMKKQQGPIPQVFRYCIACQDAVLDANIENHQVCCKQYSKVYELDLTGIIDHLSKKIQILKQKLRNYSVSLSEGDCQHFRNMCQNMQKQSSQILKTGDLTPQFQKNYDQAIKIGTKWALTTQYINKLRWFLKVREEIKKKFSV